MENVDTDRMLKMLQNRYAANKDLILTLDGSKYVSKPINELDVLVDLVIDKRGAGGVADELLIITDKNVYKVITELNIRYVLNDGKTMVHLPRQPLLERNMDATASSSRMAIHRKGWRESYPSQWNFVHLKTVLIDQITQQMLAIRAKELTQESASNLSFQFSCGDFAPGFISYTIAAESTDKMDEVKTYRTLLLAQEQLLRYGFVKTELEEAKKIFLRRLEEKKTQHPTADMVVCQQAIQQILPYITVADAWNILKYWEKMSARWWRKRFLRCSFFTSSR